MNTAIVYKKTLRDPLTLPAANGLGGWYLKLEVIEATGITPYIFVHHRGTPASEGAPFVDRFYSVASVEELETLPQENPGPDIPFYRLSSVELIFQTETERVAAAQDIEALIDHLRQANDAVVNNGNDSVLFYPATAVMRYWGASAADPISDADINNDLESEPGAERQMLKTIDTQGLKYLYAAYRNLSGPATFKINGTPYTSMQLTTRTVVNTLGHAGLYNIYRTAVKMSGVFTLEVL